MRLFSEHRLIFRRASDYGVDKTPKPMVMNQSLSANGKGIVQGPITTTNIQNGHLVGGQALPKAPNQGYTTVNPATQFNPEDAKYLSQAANTGGVGVNDTRGRNLLLAGQSGSPLQATLSSIDDKYRAAAEAGQSVDPFAVAAEKQAAAAQFQAEESARQGQMQAARDKEAKSVAMAQNALTAKTPQGQKIQQITAIRQNVRLGKITQEQANAQIQQIQSQSAASPQAPVAAPTSPTPTAANPNASTATTPAVPGAAAVGTQEASATGTEPVDANGNPVATTPQTPEEAGMDAAMLNLPPEAAFLAPFLQSLKTQTDKSIEENAQMALGQLATVEKTFGGIQDKLDGMEAGYKSTTEAMQSLLREAKESQEKQIAEAEKDQMNRVQWQQDTQERVIMKNKRQAHEAMVAQLALNGGFGQDASLRAVAESDDHFETQLADLRTEMGYARTDLSVKFSGLKNEATQNYVNSTITNMKELQANLEKISFQGMSNKVSKMQAEQAIVKDAWEKQNTLRKDLADKQYTISKDMLAVVNASRDDKRAQEQQGWQRLQWVAQTYGSSAPQALLDSIGKQLPGVDVRSVASQMTLAEMKKRGGGGGGSLGGFSGSMLQGTGQPVSFEAFVNAKKKEFALTYDQFVAQKKTELKANTNMSIADAQAALDPAKLKAEYAKRKFDDSPQAMAQLQKEYDAQVSVTKQYDPTVILDSFESRATAQNLSGPVYNRTKAMIDNYIRAGKFEQAANVVNNIGDDVDAADARSFEYALTSRTQAQELHQAIQDLSVMGPLSGRLSQLNPWDPRVVKVKSMITQMVPGMARGIFHEVGVLTDTDVERYTKTVENPNLTPEQALNAFNVLMHTIDVGLQNKIDVWDAGNKRTAGFKKIFANVNTTPPEQSADEAWAAKIMSGDFSE